MAEKTCCMLIAGQRCGEPIPPQDEICFGCAELLEEALHKAWAEQRVVDWNERGRDLQLHPRGRD